MHNIALYKLYYWNKLYVRCKALICVYTVYIPIYIYTLYICIQEQHFRQLSKSTIELNGPHWTVVYRFGVF